MPHDDVWASKIVSYGVVDLDQVLANERNWKIHSTFAQDALAGVLDEVGIVQNLIINLRHSEQWAPGDRHVATLLDGHRRVMVGMRRGQRTWPVTYVDLDPDAEKKALVTLDTTTALAGTDQALLATLLAEVQSPDAAVQQLLGGLASQGEPFSQRTPAATSTSPGTGISVIEIRCPHERLALLQPTLDMWRQNADVTIRIGAS